MSLFIRTWIICDGADNSGHFVWVDLGGRLGFREAAEEKRVFQRLLDGGVYIVRGFSAASSDVANGACADCRRQERRIITISRAGLG